MRFYMVSMIIIGMGSTLALAGTYGTELGNQLKNSIAKNENYQSNLERPTAKKMETTTHKVQGVYTRTIVRPVSYSYISANFQSIPETTTEEILPKLEGNKNFERENENNTEEPNQLQKNVILYKKPVLSGNEDELNEEELDLRKSEEPDSGLEKPDHEVQSIKPVTELSLDYIPVIRKASENIESLPVHSNKKLINHRNTFFTVKKPFKSLRNENKRGFIQRGHNLENIPEMILRPPPIPLKSRPIIVQPVSNIQYGEYRNQNSQDNQSSVLEDVEEKDTQNLINKKSAPWRSDHSLPKFNKLSNMPRTEKEEEDVDNSDESEDLEKSESGELKQQKGKPKNVKSSGGAEYNEHHEGKKTEKGEKGYKKNNKHEKAEKGHHNKEAHKGEYKEEKGQEKKVHKGEKVYGEHHKGEKGKKEKKYGEGKKHKKGHSTHGEHNIIKKDEYIKKTKFYDEDHGGGEEEEHGEFHGQSDEKKGGKKDAGHIEKGYQKKGTSKKGHHDKGHHDEEHSGYEHDEGSDEFSGYEEEHEDKKGNKASKKWEKH